MRFLSFCAISILCALSLGFLLASLPFLELNHYGRYGFGLNDKVCINFVNYIRQIWFLSLVILIIFLVIYYLGRNKITVRQIITFLIIAGILYFIVGILSEGGPLNPFFYFGCSFRE